MTRVAGRTTLYKQMYESYENMFGDKFLPVSIRNCIAVNESNTLFEPLLTYDKRCTAAQDYIELVNYLGLMDNKHFRELAKYLKEREVMAKKSFSAGATKPGILNSDGGEKLKEIQAKLNITFNIFPKKNCF